MFYLIVSFQIFADVIPDKYETDNLYTSANVIDICNPDAQSHNFHKDTDQDWVQFYGLKFEKYTISVDKPGIHCNPAIALYFLDQNNRITQIGETQNTGLEGISEEMVWTCNKNEVYYVKVWSLFVMVAGDDTCYSLSVHDSSAATNGRISGVITDKYLGSPLMGVNVITNIKRSAISNKLGKYRIFNCRQEAGIVLSTKHIHYLDYTTTVDVNELVVTNKDLVITPDIDSDHQQGLADVIWLLKHISLQDDHYSVASPVKLSVLIELLEILSRK